MQETDGEIGKGGNRVSNSTTFRPVFYAVHVYSLMQSYSNSFWENVVVDGFNNASWDEDDILDQMYHKQIFL